MKMPMKIKDVLRCPMLRIGARTRILIYSLHIHDYLDDDARSLDAGVMEEYDDYYVTAITRGYTSDTLRMEVV